MFLSIWYITLILGRSSTVGAEHGHYELRIIWCRQCILYILQSFRLFDFISRLFISLFDSKIHVIFNVLRYIHIWGIRWKWTFSNWDEYSCIVNKEWWIFLINTNAPAATIELLNSCLQLEDPAYLCMCLLHG